MDPHALRRSFLTFFEERAHAVVDSSPVVPKNDPTLLFANAGMNQFKDVFLGLEVRDYKRAASTQKCIRAGGKHNDLDEVGKDARHLTFFEMLGNWSFGDYYKRESIAWGWEFLIDVLKLDAERLYVTVYKDDDESWDIWVNEVGVPESRMLRLGDIDKGDEENFWSMGAVGPCGPCTEIHYDQHPEVGAGWGLDFDGERFTELWNHVFMEFDRDDAGKLSPLPMKSVDTGMGLERAASILQGVDSVYKTALFKGILERTATLLGKNLSQQEILEGPDRDAYRVIADHVRSVTFAVSEGQPFSNEGRGYVLRRILRRAVRFGRKLGFREPFLFHVAETVVQDFGSAFPDLQLVAAQTQEVIRLEEERFFRTLDRGIARFEEVADRAEDGVIDGRDAFTLYDTFGFPLDLTEIMAEERSLQVDSDGFRVALEEQRARSSESKRFVADEDTGPWVRVCEGDSTFLGYARTDTASRISRYRTRGEFFDIVLDMTPFYAESGGQAADTGFIQSEDGQLKFRVLDTQKSDVGIVHICQLDDGFVTEESMGKDVVALVDADRRQLIVCNHTGTHLLHAALRQVLGGEVYQAGSLVRDDKLRFDFTFSRSLTQAEIEQIEDLVNAEIRAGLPVNKHVDVPRQTAEEWGAMAIFGEKYGERVRVVEVPGFSVELCGGIHVENTRELLGFRITQESAIAAGTRRIEAVTNSGASDAAKADRRLLSDVTRAARVDTPNLLVGRIERLLQERTELEQYNDVLSRRLARAEVGAIMSTGRKVGEVDVYAGRVDVRDRKQLLVYADMLRDLMKDSVALLGADVDGKPALVCLVADPIFKTHKLKAGELVNVAASIVGGRGGGRPTLAQAGGSDLGQLDQAIQSIFGAVQTRLSN